MGHSIIMGRKTYESIGRPLPGRRNLVVSSRSDYARPGVTVVPSLQAALAGCPGESEVFVIGGAELFKSALSQADRIYLTLVEANVPGDTFFEIPPGAAWRLVREEFRPPDQDNAYPLSFKVYERD
jgi:dihydrofolate reductase